VPSGMVQSPSPLTLRQMVMGACLAMDMHIAFSPQRIDLLFSALYGSRRTALPLRCRGALGM
jgi:hypothetical protein